MQGADPHYPARAVWVWSDEGAEPGTELCTTSRFTGLWTSSTLSAPGVICGPDSGRLKAGDPGRWITTDLKASRSRTAMCRECGERRTSPVCNGYWKDDIKLIMHNSTLASTYLASPQPLWQEDHEPQSELRPFADSR